MIQHTKIQNVQVLNPHTLKLHYLDGVNVTVDLTEALKTPIFRPMQNPEVFGQVKMGARGRTLEWPGDVDLDVDTFRNADEGSKFKIIKVEKDPTPPISQVIAHTIKQSGVTQTALAKRMGTTQSVVARLTSEQYTGHSVTQLQTLAKALGKKLKIEFVDD